MTTVAILDLAHCGTTMLAGVIHRLGVPMCGARHRAGRMEDEDVFDALQSESRFAQLVEQRAPPWGFKVSEGWRWARWFERYLEQPVYLAIYKDPVSVTRRRHRNAQGWHILDTLRQMRRSVAGLTASGLPVTYLSYHAAITDPLAFTRRIARLVGVEADEAEVIFASDYIQPGGYQEVG